MIGMSVSFSIASKTNFSAASIIEFEFSQDDFTIPDIESSGEASDKLPIFPNLPSA